MRQVVYNVRVPFPTRTVAVCGRLVASAPRSRTRRVVPDLEAAGLLTHLDRAALSAYCATWGRVAELERALTTERVVMKTKKGYPVLNPTFTALQSQYKQLMAFLTESG